MVHPGIVIKSTIFVILSLSGGLSLFAQPNPQEMINLLRDKEALEKKIREEDERNKKNVEGGLDNSKQKNSAMEAVAFRKIYASEKMLPATEKSLLIPDPDDFKSYEAFLKQPNTGVFKLFSFSESRRGINDIKGQSAYPSIPGNGTYYSFLKRNHDLDEWTQIRLIGEQLQSGYYEMRRSTPVNSGGVIQNFDYVSGTAVCLFAHLGDVQLDQINEENIALKLLANLKTPSGYPELTDKSNPYKIGLRTANINFQPAIATQANTTYLMRSILYKKSDALFAFRIIKKDSYGNITVLWKQLKNFGVPDLKGKPQK